MNKILKLNEISPLINDILKDNYELTNDCANPEGIILRSYKMHDYDIPSSLLAVARAGAGVNNIPLDKMTEAGVAVFNTPGANANAVKELVICALLLASRKLVDGINWTQTLEPNSELPGLVEKGKKAFIGPELSGKKLGVIGLGAIGRMVANTAVDLDMTVLGYDPYISVDGAWSLSRKVSHVTDIKEIFTECDYITLHVPLTNDTRNTVSAESIALMKDGVKIINCSRGELVDNESIIAAAESGKVGRYISDFPSAELVGKKNIVLIPHLGASTPEAEDNCAVMAARELKDYIENGNIVNSVNFPNVSAPRTGKTRITILHKNISNMIAKASAFIGEKGINIDNLVSSSRGNIGYMIIDADGDISSDIVNEMTAQDGFLRVRVIK